MSQQANDMCALKLPMGLSIASRLRRCGPARARRLVHVTIPSFEGWEAVREFGDVGTARAWHQALAEAGIEAALTADWPIDRFGRGEHLACVRPEDWSEAELLLSNLDTSTDDRSSGPVENSFAAPTRRW